MARRSAFKHSSGHRSLGLGPALVVGLLAAVPARAQQEQGLVEQQLEQSGLAQPVSGDWDITLGAGIGAVPAFPGAQAYRAAPIPLLSVTYRDWLSLGPAGLGATLVDWHGLRAGPVIGFVGDRKQDQDPHLSGLGDIRPSVTAGAFATYRFGSFEASATAREAVTHSANGLLGVARLDYRMSLVPEMLELQAGPELGFADARHDRTWFGVTASQSVSSGLPVFTPGAGVTDVGLHAALTCHYSPHILFRALADLRELTGDDAGSPIVQSKMQGLIGVGAAYHF